MLKKLREIPTDNRDIGQVPYENIGTSIVTNHGTIGTNQNCKSIKFCTLERPMWQYYCIFR